MLRLTRWRISSRLKVEWTRLKGEIERKERTGPA
jgi:hypothetical protein